MIIHQQRKNQPKGFFTPSLIVFILLNLIIVSNILGPFPNDSYEPFILLTLFIFYKKCFRLIRKNLNFNFNRMILIEFPFVELYLKTGSISISLPLIRFSHHPKIHQASFKKIQALKIPNIQQHKPIYNQTIWYLNNEIVLLQSNL
jgi:hypothetical protein